MKRLSKALLMAVPVVALGIGGVAYAALQPDGTQAPRIARVAQHKQVATAEASTLVSTTQPAENTPASPQTSEPAPTNPYQKGSNLWHAFSRRAEVGLTTPTGSDADQTYWQGVREQMSNTPSQYAIAFSGQNTSSLYTVAGVVESVNLDGSLTISCTNCGQWNVLTNVQVSAESASSYRYLQ